MKKRELLINQQICKETYDLGTKLLYELEKYLMLRKDDAQIRLHPNWYVMSEVAESIKPEIPYVMNERYLSKALHKVYPTWETKRIRVENITKVAIRLTYPMILAVALHLKNQIRRKSR